MQSRSYSTRTVKESELKREWFIVDAEGKTLGRMTSKIASVLRGKHKPTFTPNADCGDFVIVINSAKVRMTGKKMTDRFLVRYTGYPGGQRHATPKEIIEKNANRKKEIPNHILCNDALMLNINSGATNANITIQNALFTFFTSNSIVCILTNSSFSDLIEFLLNK